MVIGITGSLGTGKSTVAGMFGRLGAYVIDADLIAHKLLSSDKDAQREIIAVFGRSILTKGKIDRKKLGAIVFNSKRDLKRLCGIIHPRVIDIVKKKVRAAKRKTVAVSAPLLIEAKLHRGMDKVIVVTTDKRTQMARCASLGFSRKEALKRIKNQMPLREKIRFADFIIDNSMSRKNTRKQVLEIWKKINEDMTYGAK